MTSNGLVVEASKLADNLSIIRRAVVKSSNGLTPTIKRVAAYCRVSTDLEEQERSLQYQIETYNRIINKHANWELVDIYADEGLTGTMVRKRIGFQRMIRDAEAGRIDIIIAKSISRFARNTVDTLEYIKYLKKLGVGVVFEKEGVDTSGFSYEFMLTVLAAFAQEESHSISENTKRGIRNRFKLGIPMWSEVYGLKPGWQINEEEAKVIRLIFQLFLEDKSVAQVAEELNRRKIATPGSTKKWNTVNVGKILVNEKYVGDVLMQKTYVSDYMEHRSLKNNGARVEQYYKRNHHEAIVDRVTFVKAQNLYAMRNPRNGPLQYPYYGFLKCPCCGKNMVNVYVSGSINANAWTCGGEGLQTKLQDRSNCPTYLLQDAVLTRTLMGVIRKLDPYAEANRGFARPICDAQNIIGQQGKIVYSIVDKLVESITLEDWQHLRVCWRMGYSSVCVIEYSYLREAILPIISTNARGAHVCFGNFVQCKDKFLEAFRRRQQRVLQYEVMKSLYSNCQVPKLISPEQQRKDRCMHGN